jgi:hypothetical protein
MLALISQDRKFILKGAAAGLTAAALFLPWVPVILSDLGIQAFWTRMPGPAFLAEYFYYYFGKDALVTAVFLFCLYLFVRQHFRRDTPGINTRTVDYVIVVWLIFSYLIPYVKSVIGPPMLFVRYAIVTLPAWFLAIAIGWEQIQKEKWRYIIAAAVSLSMVINIVFVRQHYSEVSKQQVREMTELVKVKNTSGVPVYSRYAWHFNYYFKDHPTKISELGSADFSAIDRFWLLQAEFFSAAEKQELLNEFANDFDIVETNDFFKTQAVLLERRK